MSDTSEHRGWEINTDHNQHVLDDPFHDIAEDGGESGGGMFWGLLVVLLLVGLALYGMRLWLTPPQITFKAAGPPGAIIVSQSQPQYLCLHYSGKTNVLRPNWESAVCSVSNAKKNGWLQF